MQRRARPPMAVRLIRRIRDAIALPRLGHIPVVFLDTSVIKLAAFRRIVPVRRSKTLQFGPHSITAPITQWVERFSTPKPDQVPDFRLLPFVARLATRGRIRLITSLDVNLEAMRLPPSHNPQGPFYGAPIAHVATPGIGRVIASPEQGFKEHQMAFLRRFQDVRFRELVLATGAYQGGERYIDNQLVDAFHTWCAERAGADYLLTGDYKLIRLLERHRATEPRVGVLTPRRLAWELLRRCAITLTDVVDYVQNARRSRHQPAVGHPLDGLVDLGKTLERQGYYDP